MALMVGALLVALEARREREIVELQQAIALMEDEVALMRGALDDWENAAASVVLSPDMLSRVRDLAIERTLLTAGQVSVELHVATLTARRLLGELAEQRILEVRPGQPTRYVYVEPEFTATQARPRRMPPEREPPAYTSVPSGRGEPVRIRTERQMRRSLSTPGARQHHRMAEARYQREMAAKEARAQAQQSKAQKDPKWKRKKKASRPA